MACNRGEVENLCICYSLRVLDVVTTIMLIIFWEFLVFDQIFVSSEVKRSAVVCNKDGIYELLHELPNDFGLKS